MTVTHNIKPGSKIKSSLTGNWYEVSHIDIRPTHWPEDAVPVTSGGYLVASLVSEVQRAPKRPTQQSNSWNEAIIDLALEHERNLVFDYAHLHDHTTRTREVIPEHVVTTNAGHRLLVGQDVPTCEYRTFRLDQIQGDIVGVE